MTRFIECLEFVLAREGGKVDDPADRGGRTAFGITQSVYDAWRPVPRDVWAITPEEVAEIYRSRYWDAIKGDQLPPRFDLALFDSSVNHGRGNAVKFLQRSLSTADDGVLGPVTMGELIARIGAGEADETLRRYISARRAFYAAIVARDPSQAKFSRGWSNRLAALSTELGVA